MIGSAPKALQENTLVVYFILHAAYAALLTQKLAPTALIGNTYINCNDLIC
jgi:hypothetical protein